MRCSHAVRGKCFANDLRTNCHWHQFGHQPDSDAGTTAGPNCGVATGIGCISSSTDNPKARGGATCGTTCARCKTAEGHSTYRTTPILLDSWSVSHTQRRRVRTSWWVTRTLRRGRIRWDQRGKTDIPEGAGPSFEGVGWPLRKLNCQIL